MAGKFSKKRPARKPLGKRQARAVKSIAEKAIKQQAEWKYGLTSQNVSVGTTPSLFSVHGTISQGSSDESQRIGDEFVIGSMRMRYQLTQNASGNPSQSVRVLVFQYFNANTPAAATILDNTLSKGWIFATYSTDGQSQGYRVLYDKVHTITQQVASTSPNSRLFNLKLRPGRKKLKYSDDSSTAARNGIWVLLASDEATNTPTFDCQTRLNYMDL